MHDGADFAERRADFADGSEVLLCWAENIDVPDVYGQRSGVFVGACKT